MIIKIYKHNHLEKTLDVFDCNREIWEIAGAHFDMIFHFRTLEEAEDCFGDNIPKAVWQAIMVHNSALVIYKGNRESVTIPDNGEDGCIPAIKAALHDFCDIDIAIARA